MSKFSSKALCWGAVFLGSAGLSGCQFMPQKDADVTCECAKNSGDDESENGASVVGNIPDPEPTASIFGPKAEVPEPKSVLEDLELSIGFISGSDLSDTATMLLQEVMASEQFAQGKVITLRGHSDAGGDDATNMRVSLARAEVVRDWFVGQGVAPERIRMIAFGEQNPVASNALPNGDPDEVGRASNRRVEILIAASDETVNSSEEAVADEETSVAVDQPQAQPQP